jgi:hypothetical protein
VRLQLTTCIGLHWVVCSKLVQATTLLLSRDGQVLVAAECRAALLCISAPGGLGCDQRNRCSSSLGLDKRFGDRAVCCMIQTSATFRRLEAECSVSVQSTRALRGSARCRRHLAVLPVEWAVC